MFRNTYQKGFLSIFFSIGSSPLAIWKTTVQNGHIKRLTDEDIKSTALEIMGVNVETTYITVPIMPKASLAIKLPFFVLIIKYMKKFFSFEVQILDDKNMLRRFRISNYQSASKVNPFCSTMPLALCAGWNEIFINLADFTRRAYGTNYVETVRIQIHANIRIRRLFFSDRLYEHDEKPREYRLNPSILLPIMKMNKKKIEKGSKKHPVSPVKTNPSRLDFETNTINDVADVRVDESVAGVIDESVGVGDGVINLADATSGIAVNGGDAGGSGGNIDNNDDIDKDKDPISNSLPPIEIDGN